MDEISKLLAIVTIIGFAIQQIIELINPIVLPTIVNIVRNVIPKNSQVDEQEIRKISVQLMSISIGAVVVISVEISVLELLKEEWKGGIVDVLVSALVLGAGTEGLNSLTKYAGYVKAGRKANLAPAVEIAVSPSSTTVGSNDSVTFRSIVKNAQDTTVEWSVLHSSGGSISPDGTYTPPSTVGTYQVIATSMADRTKHAVGTVKVV